MTETEETPPFPFLKGKAALVTGSTSGIGLASAEMLARSGAHVMLNGLGDPAEIEGHRARIGSTYGVTCRYHGANLMKPAEIEALIRETHEAFGAVDILVNNAGMQHTAATEEFPVEKYDAIIALNQNAVFHACRHAIPLMKAKGWGRIINIASVHGLVASVNKIAYIASKHAVVGMTKVMALELAETRITVNAICPGWVRTPLIEAQIEARAQKLGVEKEEGARDLVGEKQPSKTFVQPEQIGQVIVFLCSDAASEIRGVPLPVDGGWTAQ